MGKLGSKAVWGAALALWVMIPAASASASGGSGKLDKLLQEAGPSAQPVIVRYRTTPGRVTSRTASSAAGAASSPSTGSSRR